LLCGFPENSVSKILLALDATREVIDEAACWGAELIVTHHPVIFTPLKRLLVSETDGARIIKAIKKDVSILSLHTNLDIVDGGVNTTLAALLGLQEQTTLDIGRMGQLPAPMEMSAFLGRCHGVLSVSGMRYLDVGRPVSSVAVCGGSGGDLVSAAAAAGCDTLVTGEIRHHQWLEGRERGLNLIEADHYCTEAIVLPVLEHMLAEGFPMVEIQRSKIEGQPSRGY